jgi:hypothetical protein
VDLVFTENMKLPERMHQIVPRPYIMIKIFFFFANNLFLPNQVALVAVFKLLIRPKI